MAIAINPSLSEDKGSIQTLTSEMYDNPFRITQPTDGRVRCQLIAFHYRNATAQRFKLSYSSREGVCYNTMLVGDPDGI